MKNKEKRIVWYNDASMIVNLIIAVVAIIILSSQSFANQGGLSFANSVINHNSIYLLVLVYFILIKTKIGKRYFNYINIILIFTYLMSCVTSFLTMIQSFSLPTVFSFTISFLLVIYLVHTLLRDTFIWSDYQLNNSPFNEFTNEWMFYGVVVISVFLLSVNLIFTEYFKGVVISFLDSLYYILFARYIYLYRLYLDKKNINSDNKGNFNEIRENIKNTVEDVLDKTDIDERVIEIKDKLIDSKNVENIEVEEKKTKAKRTRKKVSKKGEE